MTTMCEALWVEMNLPSCPVKCLPCGISTVKVEPPLGDSTGRAYLTGIKDSAQKLCPFASSVRDKKALRDPLISSCSYNIYLIKILML